MDSPSRAARSHHCGDRAVQPSGIRRSPVERARRPRDYGFDLAEQVRANLLGRTLSLARGAVNQNRKKKKKTELPLPAITAREFKGIQGPSRPNSSGFCISFASRNRSAPVGLTGAAGSLMSRDSRS